LVVRTELRHRRHAQNWCQGADAPRRRSSDQRTILRKQPLLLEDALHHARADAKLPADLEDFFLFLKHPTLSITRKINADFIGVSQSLAEGFLV
jgi:hypothetical protein